MSHGIEHSYESGNGSDLELAFTIDEAMANSPRFQTHRELGSFKLLHETLFVLAVCTSVALDDVQDVVNQEYPAGKDIRWCLGAGPLSDVVVPCDCDPDSTLKRHVLLGIGEPDPDEEHRGQMAVTREMAVARVKHVRSQL